MSTSEFSLIKCVDMFEDISYSSVCTDHSSKQRLFINMNVFVVPSPFPDMFSKKLLHLLLCSAALLRAVSPDTACSEVKAAELKKDF